MAKKQNTSIRNEAPILTETPIRVTSVINSAAITVPQKENFIKPIDPQKLRIQAKYKTSGLTVTSNNTNIIPRDAAGNILLKEDEQNRLLIIEPVATKITTESVLKVLDTRFNYYKFPVTIIETTSNDIDLDTDIELDLADNVYARYRPSSSFRLQLPAGNWSDEAKFNSLTFDFVEEGVSQKRAGHYFITPDIKNSGIDLRFSIKIEHRFDSFGEIGTCFFSIIKNSPITGLNKLFEGPFANSAFATGNWGEIGQYEVQTLNLDLVIPNEEFLEGDYFILGGFGGQNNDAGFHTIGEIQSYWVITDASKNVDEWNQEI
jgi:hypothetical protein